MFRIPEPRRAEGRRGGWLPENKFHVAERRSIDPASRAPDRYSSPARGTREPDARKGTPGRFQFLSNPRPAAPSRAVEIVYSPTEFGLERKTEIKRGNSAQTSHRSFGEPEAPLLTRIPADPRVSAVPVISRRLSLRKILSRWIFSRIPLLLCGACFRVNRGF